ncbi:MAG: serine/threonine protein kinase [Candidatus Obscuribacterales bacterium]|nr:serine/threonine protein kinase [Candidatus Obscuribacterales bacterium]
MAEAEITIKYRELLPTLVYRCLFFILPAYIIFLIWTSLVAMFMMGRGDLSISSGMVLLGGEAIVLLILGLLAACLSDHTIYVTREGLSFPFLISPGPRFRNLKKWDELAGVVFAPGGNSGNLTLKFEQAAPVKLKLKTLDEKTVDDLIVAIDVWGGGSDSFPALLEARTYLHGVGETDELSYTEMWEDELARRFGSTNFIPLEPGDSIYNGKLKVERQIAFGGMSAIYLVSDGMEKLVLKESVVPADSDQELKDKAIEMLTKEARLLAGLDHRQIARVIDIFVEGSRHYLLLEHLKGQDLRRLIQEFGAQDESFVLDWSMQITQILTYLHGRPTPIIHKDLTPSNLILTEQGVVCLIDFGAANLFLGTATGTIIGKQAYIAPEQLRGKARQASDLYALGATIYFLLTGLDPEPISVNRPRATHPKVSKELDALVASLTQMEPEDRPASIEEVAFTLAGIMAKKR